MIDMPEIKPIEYEAKTLWAGRAWVHAKYLNQSVKQKRRLIIKYKSETMAFEPWQLKESFSRSKVVEDKFDKDRVHKQYGVIWNPAQKAIDF